MNRKSNLLGLALIVIAAAGVIAQTIKSAADPSIATAGTLREIVVAPNGGIAVKQPGQVIAGREYRGFDGPGVDGRCVTVFASKATIFDIVFQPGNDDALGFVGDTRGALVAHCIFRTSFSRANDPGKALIGYGDPNDSSKPGPIHGAADGYTATFYRCDFQGGAVRLAGGVWQFIGCRFVITALGGVQANDVRINFIDCDFLTVQKPANWGYWYQRGDPCGVRVQAFVDGKQAASPLASRLYFANCRLDGRPVDGPTLCRRFPNAADLKAGRTAYGLPGSVPAAVFVKESLSK